MTWLRSLLGQLPFSVPGLPGLTGAVLLWGGAFVVAALFALPLAARAWRGLAITWGSSETPAEVSWQVGQAAARTCGALMVLAGLVAAVVAAVAPPPLPRPPLRDASIVVILALLWLAALVLVQSLVLELSQRAARRLWSRRVNLLTDAFVVVDQGGRVAMTNPALEDLLGWPREDILGQPVEVLVPQALAEAHVDHVQDFFGDPHTRPMGQHHLPLFARHRDGQQISVVVGLSVVSGQSGLLVLATIRETE